jgi:hypothetical protein
MTAAVFADTPNGAGAFTMACSTAARLTSANCWPCSRATGVKFTVRPPRTASMGIDAARTASVEH